MGGPVYSLDYYIQKATSFRDMGADSLCIKDMAGMLRPHDAHVLIGALKEAIGIPIQLHCHFTSGLAYMTYWEAIEAGVDIIDTALAPLALRSSQPAVEPVVAGLRGEARDTGIDLDALLDLDDVLESVVPKYRDFVDTTRLSTIDPTVLRHQIPGGMVSSMISQLRSVNAVDRLKEVCDELPRTRKDFGQPPLVTPTSQIIGVQAIQNVLMGRYKVMSLQARDYVCGYYGRPPAAIDPEVKRIALKGYRRKPIDCRPADLLDPELDRTREALRDMDASMGDLIARDVGNLLIHSLFPKEGESFLRAKYGLAEPPETAESAKTLDDIRREDDLIANLKGGNGR
jgi:pyruvate carboxylase subunit B